MKNRMIKILLWTFMIGALVVALVLNHKPPTETKYFTHVVMTNETVWEIAKEYADGQTKPFNEFVYSIQHENKLTGRCIHPGDVLIIPMSVPVNK